MDNNTAQEGWPSPIDGLPPYGDLHPEELFWEHTLLLKEEKHFMEQHCLAYWHLALIDYDEQHHMWIWHSLVDLKGQRTWKKAIAARFPVPQTPRRTKERKLVDTIVTFLEGRGIQVETEVTCATGVADIVTYDRTIVFEVKYRLTRAAILMAIGQVLLYRLCFNQDARAIIVGYETKETAILLPYIQQLDIEVLLWQETVSE